MTPTSRDRFRGALTGALLGPIYHLQWQARFQPATTSAEYCADALLTRQWNTLAAAGKQQLQQLEDRVDTVESRSDDTAGCEVEPELRLLGALPPQLLDSAWQTDPLSLANFLLTPEVLGSHALDLAMLLQAVGPFWEQAAYSWELLLSGWLHSQAISQEPDGRACDRARDSSGPSTNPSARQAQTRLGCQLLGLLWGANQGIQAIPMTSKAVLGDIHPELLELGDRLYGTWTGRADLEELGVSCEGSLPMATPTVLA